jgi:hypothetical protein
VSRVQQEKKYSPNTPQPILPHKHATFGKFVFDFKSKAVDDNADADEGIEAKANMAYVTNKAYEAFEANKVKADEADKAIVADEADLVSEAADAIEAVEAGAADGTNLTSGCCKSARPMSQ